MIDQFVVPKSPAVVQSWAADFTERYGMPPFAGGETAAPAPPVAPAPPAAPAAAPPAPAAPAAPAAALPGAPAAAPAEAQSPAEPQPQWAKELIEGVEKLMPPAQYDPLAVDLGFAPAPPQPLPGQPAVDPSQMGPAAGQPQAVGIPPQAPALPGQAQQPVPGQPQSAEVDAVNRLIDERAREVAAGLVKEQVTPYIQQQEDTRRRSENAALRNDYPEMQDPAQANNIIVQAKRWATETLGNPAAAAEPGFLELTILAMRQMKADDAQRAAAAAANPGAQPGAGEVPIEGAGAGGPAPVQTSEQLAQSIVDAKPGGGLNSLWV